MSEWIDTFLDDEFNQCIFGMVLYFSVICWLETSKSKLTIFGWLKKNGFQLFIGAIVCLIMVAKDDEIMRDFFAEGKKWPWYVYFSGGIVLNILYQVVALFPKIAEYFVKKFSPIK